MSFYVCAGYVARSSEFHDSISANHIMITYIRKTSLFHMEIFYILGCYF